MIYLYTGIPGAGKTLNAIKFVLHDERFKNRNVYAHNINGLDIPHWQEIDKDEATEWYNLPDGSVVIIDECQDIWRPLKTGSTVPETIQRLEKHRHQGIDLVLTCQYPRQIHIGVRRLVTNHFHLFRPFGMNTISQLQWEQCEDDPKDYHAKQRAQKKRITLDKKIFDKYKSAEVHTVKRVIPKKLIALIICIFFFIGLIFYIYNLLRNLGKDENTENQTTEQTQQQSESQSPFSYRSKYDEFDYTKYATNYLKDRSNIIPNDDKSKPIYRELHKPVSLPRENCLANQKRTICKCYSQQATIMQVDLNTCLYYIDNGYPFDYTRPDIDQKTPIRQNKKASASEQAQTARSPRFTTIPHIGRPTFPTTDNSFKGVL